VERHALAAKLVDRAEAWPWNSAHQRQGKAICPWLLKGALGPTPRPQNWLELINTPLPAKEHKRIEHSVPLFALQIMQLPVRFHVLAVISYMARLRRVATE
jgi:hypothetical protein